MIPRILAFVALILAASIADVRVTLKIIAAGRGREANPLMRRMIRLRPWLAYATSLLMTAGVVVIGCILIGSGAAAYGWALLILLAVVRVGSVIWNISVWKRRL